MGKTIAQVQPVRIKGRKSSPQNPKWIPLLIAITLLFLISELFTSKRDTSSPRLSDTWGSHDPGRTTYSSRDEENLDTKELMGLSFMRMVEPPRLPKDRETNAERTLFLLPGKENKCHYQYDYICKFWFYIRCYVYAAFPNVEMLSLGSEAVSEFKQRAKDGDIAMVIWRSKNHSLVPEGLTELLQWRKESGDTQQAPRVRIGVLHIANEVNRSDWFWYTMPDFIVRNYWIPDLPPHVTYIPLGPQMPNVCTPRSTDEYKMTDERLCECGGLAYRRASARKFIWNFSGSLRKKRAELLRRLRKSPTLNHNGFVMVSKKFGGDGVFGSIEDNPKNVYLESILDSQFVFAPCGNAMETHRIYEALALGAIPVIENCDPTVSHFFPFRELLIDGGTEQMVRFVESFLPRQDLVDELQARVTSWWLHYAFRSAHNVSLTVQRHVPQVSKFAP